MTPTEISIEQLLNKEIPETIRFNKDLIIINDMDDLHLFAHPTRLKATTVLICISGSIDCSINLKRYQIKENDLLVNFSGDIIQVHNVDSVSGYAMILSKDYLHELQFDFRLRAQCYVNIRNNGPLHLPHEELIALKPYYMLFRKNMEDLNSDVVRALTQALSHTVIALMKRYQPTSTAITDTKIPRAQQLFDQFMQLLHTYHTSERSLQFYADQMFLTPKYIAGVIKNYSGKAALAWINEFVILEAKMMLLHTDMTVQEIAYKLNFPTQSAFGKYFKNLVGISPTLYRTSAA